jgi:hypothetical protein
MPLDTTHGNDVLLLGGQVVWGTCMLGDDFGQVESSSVKRTADKVEIENCAGNLKTLLLTKCRFELTLETIFDANVAAPGKMERIALPLIGVTGRVMDVTVKWEKGKERGLSIEVSHWDSLANGTGYVLTPGGVYTSLDHLSLFTGDPLAQHDDENSPFPLHP